MLIGMETNVVFLSDYRPRVAAQGVCEFEAQVRASKDFGESDGPALVSDGTEGCSTGIDDMQTRVSGGKTDKAPEPIGDIAKRIIASLEKKRAAKGEINGRPGGTGHRTDCGVIPGQGGYAKKV